MKEISLIPRINKANNQINFQLKKTDFPKDMKVNLMNLKELKVNIDNFKFKW